MAISAPSTDSSALREAVTTGGIMEHLEAFQTIADENDGVRASGTSGYDASVDYVVSQLDPSYFDIEVQEFQFDVFRELAPAELEQISPTATVYDNEDPDAVVYTMEYSGSGDVTGTLVATNDIVIPPGAEASTSSSGCELADYPTAPTEPAIALVQRGTCDFVVKAELAQQAGYEAIIIFNEGQEGRQETLNGTLSADNTSTIPAVGVDFATGEALYNLLQSGEEVTMRVATSGEILVDQT
ncbi:MAG TPA: PA domain-containing protein, partial [Solirubrobacteraceae bacterium]|nr:PA domain-containing protein [Solirubrobacteraceae bacterium]